MSELQMMMVEVQKHKKVHYRVDTIVNSTDRVIYMDCSCGLEMNYSIDSAAVVRVRPGIPLGLAHGVA